MSQMAVFDPDVFSAFEYTGWQRVADQYIRAFADLTLQAVEPLLIATNVQPGMDVLDIACGQGDLAARAAHKGARVVGVDFSEAMLTLARQRHPALEFLQGNAEALPFADACFDAVVINFGLLHFSRPALALSEVYRVLRPGAKLGFTVWASPEEALGFGIILQAIADYGNWQVALPEAPYTFQLSESAECARTLYEAGFIAPTITRLPLLWELPSADALFQAMYAGTVRTGSMLRAQTREALAALSQSVAYAIQPYARGATFTLPMSAVLASATKP